MPSNHFLPEEIKGLRQEEVIELQKQYFKNILKKEESVILHLLKEVFTEPMFLLLAAACAVYLMLGEMNEGIMTIVAILLVAAISIYQGARSSKALEALKELTEPRAKVIRDGRETIISSSNLLPGDILILEEGDKVPADAIIIKSNDLSANESVITGESLPVDKKINEPLYQGVVIQSGMCYAKVIAIGQQTVLGKIGKSVEQYSAPKTLLQQAISRFVKRLAIFGLLAFVFIWAFNYAKSGDLLLSLLSGLTLTMAAIPEEIPVAFSSFMALGAYRMSKLGIISRQPAVIENLGAVSVICLDKTGTITENRMEVNSIYDFSTNQLTGIQASEVLSMAALASEINPFDEMEKTIVKAQAPFQKTPLPEMVFEYPLQDHPPMMTHVFGEPGNYMAAAKGAPERIMKVCRLDEATAKKISDIVMEQAEKGYRVIGVCTCEHKGNLPVSQYEFSWQFLGLIGLYDPPRKNINKVFDQFREAGIEVKLITGDFSQTAKNIAGKVGLPDGLHHFEGDAIMRQSMEELQKTVQETVIFARMFPEAKLRVIEALKLNGEIVAMTGDGVNDGPALKASNIGIAMGKRGTQIARQAADIILTDDDLQKVTEAIRQGRKIFSNLKKAVRYIISIHIPIILVASLPLLFGWKYPNIFTPVHVIFLELIMGPTCSIFFENEPEEMDAMKLPPRKRHIGLFQNDEILISILQGLIITVGILVLDYYFSANQSIEAVRSIVFTSLLLSNIFLTFTNRSFREPITKTIAYKNHLAPIILLISIALLLSIHLVTPIRSLFGMESLNSFEIVVCLITALASVMWFEVYKLIAFRHKTAA